MNSLLSSLPLRRIEEHSRVPMARESWQGAIPVVRQLLDEGLDLSALKPCTATSPIWTVSV